LDKIKEREQVRKEIIYNELYELGIYVQDYGLYISKQIGDILPLVQAIPRLSPTGEEVKEISFAS